MANRFVVEDRIPPPSPRERHHKKYPWRELKVGQSFFVPTKDALAARSFQRQAHTQAMRMGVRFTVSQRWENGTLGVRVWKVSESRKKTLAFKPAVQISEGE